MTQQPVPPAKKGPSFKLILSLLLALVAIIFVLQNSQEVRIRLFTVEVFSPLVLALAILFVTGALVVYLLMWQRMSALRKENKQLRKQIENSNRNI
jgi:uncharacterized integral membrane protein